MNKIPALFITLIVMVSLAGASCGTKQVHHHHHHYPYWSRRH